MVLASLPPAVRVRAPGKINVYLGVGGRHGDGFHDIAAVFQAVSLYDEVVAREAAEITVTVRGTDALQVPRDERNLALRAATLLAGTTGYQGGVQLDILKGIPVAGGMSGASADAAAALVACDALWGTGLSAQQLHELAARLGPDVPFALHGGTAVGAGRGDRINPALARGRFDWVIVTSGTGLPTPLIYDRLDAQRTRVPVDPTLRLEVPIILLQALRAGDAHSLAASMHNDLELPALRERSGLDTVIKAGLDAGALSGIVSGSGPTIAFLCGAPDSARYVQMELAEAGYAAQHVYGPVPGARVIG